MGVDPTRLVGYLSHILHIVESEALDGRNGHGRHRRKIKVYIYIEKKPEAR